jgi:hypothetical protein
VDGAAVTTEAREIRIPKMFETNLGKQGLIFPKNHSYYKDIPRSELRKSILYLPPENTYTTIELGAKTIDVHPLHGKDEMQINIETCAMLLKHDPDAKLNLLPVIEEKDIATKDKFYSKEYIENFKLKNADALYNGKEVEFEEPSGKGNSIQNTLRSAKEQSDFIIMRVPDDSDLDKIQRRLYGQLKFYEGKNIEIWVMNNNELRKYKSR